METYRELLLKQREFYQSQMTKGLSFRKEQLKKLYTLVCSFDNEIKQALKHDFGKPEFEAYGTEIGLVKKEISIQIRNLSRWSSRKYAGGNILDFISTGWVQYVPTGQVLILSPWNYPFMLSMSPLAGAISAGNTVIVKPSEAAPCTAAVISRMINENFPSEYLYCLEGDAKLSESLTRLGFDMIFFTGSVPVGKKVMQAAADNLSRVVLELGGKNPCIIHKSADIDTTCKRIVWGKFLNGGQSCVAPDYALVDKKISLQVKDRLIDFIRLSYGDEARNSPDFSRIINASHFNRLQKLLAGDKIFFGGKTDESDRYISPTLMENIMPDDPVMQEEIFGPVLPVIDYEDYSEISAWISRNPNPLSCYIFSRDRTFTRKILREVEAGNFNINDTTMQFANTNLPFGGRKTSGIGSYHGRYSFECFSHLKAVNRRFLWPDIPLRYPPYSRFKTRLIQRLLS